VASPSEAVIHVHPAGPLLALVGNPNTGKTALFNRLTGSRQKVANYAGVTVERKEGRLHLTDAAGAARTVRVLDLPGTYSLYPRSPDERVTCDVLAGQALGERQPDALVCVLDATNLRRSLRLVLAVQRLGLPMVVVVNMMDKAAASGIAIDTERLAALLGVPVVATAAKRGEGMAALVAALAAPDWRAAMPPAPVAEHPALADAARVQAMLGELGLADQSTASQSDRIDRVVLHPVVGPLLLALLLFVLFQAVYAGAEPAKAVIEAVLAAMAGWVEAWLPAGWLRSLINDGLLAGVGGVLTFLPQILILFAFILVLEESGYLPRAAYLLDRLMGSVGLSGRSFIPLLSSFACAIPGIMATRSIAHPRDRLVTIMIAPLMTCSARLPVYALLIGAFVPARRLVLGLSLQGVVLFVLYLAGIVGAMAVAWVLKVCTRSGRQVRPLMMELPHYHWPDARSVLLGLWQRTVIFVRRVGTTILFFTLALWLLASFPLPPDGATGPAIQYSIAGQIGHFIAPLFEPIGFNWQISLALIPGMAAREIAISALGTVYALSGDGDAQRLGQIVAQQWSAATAYALLAWYVFAPQCLSTLAVVRRETGGYTAPAIMLAYLFALAYAAAFVTYRLASAIS